MPAWKQRKLLQEAQHLKNFPSMMLGLREVYPWQEAVLGALNEKHAKVALKAANGSGKTSMVAASSHLARRREASVIPAMASNASSHMTWIG